MELLTQNSHHIPGIISIPNTTTEPACPKFLIIVVPDIRKFMEEQNINKAWVIYFDTYEEALQFKEELYAHNEPLIAKEIESKRGAK